jgi:hypothetical protein
LIDPQLCRQFPIIKPKQRLPRRHFLPLLHQHLADQPCYRNADIDVFAARFNDAGRRQAGGIRVADGSHRRRLRRGWAMHHPYQRQRGKKSRQRQI